MAAHYPEAGTRPSRRGPPCHLQGEDPARKRREAKLAAAVAASHRFGDVAEEYIRKREAEGLAPATIAKAEWFLKQLRPALGRLPIVEVTPHDLLSALRVIERRGNRETARRLRSFASRVFRYAVATLRADRDPAQLLAGALITPVTRHHAAITTPEALGILMRELRQADWSDIDFEKAVWRIPAERTKSRMPHAVPLSRQVVAMLKDLAGLTNCSGYVFASASAWRRPISENTLNQALRRLGFGSTEVTPHGLRATASTLLNECGLWSADAIERALAHRDRNAIRGTYHRGQHWDERVAMAQWWSDYLDMLRGNLSACAPELPQNGSSMLSDANRRRAPQTRIGGSLA